MNRFLLSFFVSFFFYFSSLEAQKGFTDDFTDGEYLTNPNWTGDTSKFIVNSSNQLQLNDNTTGSAFLITNSVIANQGIWEFYVEMDFDPSSSNYSKVYLVSDQQNLNGSLNGYFVRVGGQSSIIDDVSLYRQSGTSSTKIIDGPDSTVAFNPRLKVKVTKDVSGNWELFIDTSQTLDKYILQGTVIDVTHTKSKFAGVYCKYTSTRSDKFFFDDFIADSTEFQDTIGPKITLLSIIDNQTLELTFNESVDSASTQTLANYSINKGIGNPQSVNYNPFNKNKLTLSFSKEFVNATDYELITNGVKDLKNNRMLADISNFFYFIDIPPKYREIVINELYPDFNPSNGLPEGEFIELYNASNQVFDLNNWSISDGTTIASFTSKIFKPGEYLILSPENLDTIFQKYGQTQGLARFPSLNNTGDHIQLFDKFGMLVDEVKYSIDWYKSDIKEDGGYSIEQINPYTQCTGIINFNSSIASIGGTPGAKNSIFDSLPDTTPPSIVSYTINSANSLRIGFNESIDTNSITLNNFIFSPPKSIANVELSMLDFLNITIELNDFLDSGINVALSISGISDCEGNIISPNSSISFILPFSPLSNDIVINEILFNPRTGGSDFIELYNRSNKVFNLKDLKTANEDENIIDNIKDVSIDDFLFFPGEYIGLTEDLKNIKDEYLSTRKERFIEVKDLPSYNDQKGTVYILDQSEKVIDHVYYDEDFHFELLKDYDGVSLERLSSERPSNDYSNFHSASEASGFATPGYENSQAFKNTKFSGEVTVDPESFSPDNDGYQDILNINYQFNTPGFVANIEIYDRNGRLIKSLINNQLLGNKGTFSWDGITNENSKARIGIYVIYFNVFHPNGNQEAYKKAFVLAGKL